MTRLLPKKPVKTLVILIYLTLLLLALYFVLPRVIGFLLPFLVGYAISWLIGPVVRFLERKLHFPRKLAVILTMLIAIGIIGLFLFTIIYQAVYELQALAYQIPGLLEGDFALPDWLQNLNKFYIDLPDNMQGFIDMIVDSIKDNVSQIIQPATQAMIAAAGSIAGALPTIFVFTVITMLATYFISHDKERIHAVIAAYTPEGVRKRVVFVKNSLLRACGGYFKAQLILMGITFCLLLVGFLILRLDAAILLALLIAVVDAIPVLGTGTVLIPWALVSLLQGNYMMAVGLIIIYLCALLTRQMLEPRIVSGQIGLHPLVTLFSMYAGLRLMGVVGMIIGPITAIIVINLVRANEEFRAQSAEQPNEAEVQSP